MLLLLSSLSLLAQSPHGEELNIDCAQCHTPAGWEVSLDSITFDHNVSTSYELEGVHSQTDCMLCHESLIFNEEVGLDCISCHDDVHSMSVGNDCVRCHTADSWLVDNIPELHEENGFPLIGAHGNLSCVECHEAETNIRFDRIGNDCISCHNDDYLATTEPDHVSVGYSTECMDCHNPLGFDWSADPLTHDFFPLVEGHDIQDCNECHTGTSFSDAPSDCVACHQADFDQATNPSHTRLGLSTDCVSCHTLAVDWMPARFDIHNQFYALNGEHAEIDCAECHFGDYNTLPPTDCFGCHEDDYNNASPDHLSAGFSTNCLDCHTEDDWEPSTFDHDGMYFPIFSGEHKGAWTECADCHNVPNDYSQFSCFLCHLKGDMDDEHNDVNGYEYVSARCLECHPDGSE